jgi:hypothetical protein
MASFGVFATAKAVMVALKLTDHEGTAKRGTSVMPRTRGSSQVAKAQRTTEAAYRAAFVANCATRVQESLNTMPPPAAPVLAPVVPHRAPPPPPPADLSVQRDIVRREARYAAAAERARKARMEAAAAVGVAADKWGVTLGWYAHNDDRATPECVAADGKNFSTEAAPLIGWPGTPHGGTCRCEAGPPFETARTVDSATAHLFDHTYQRMTG